MKDKSKSPGKCSSAKKPCSSCQPGCCSPSGPVGKAACPACGRLAPKVPRSAARGLLKRPVSVPADGDFFLCDDPECPVSYFTASKSWKASDTAPSLDFKAGAKTRYACYCNRVTYGEVAAAMKKTGTLVWEQLIKTAKGKIVPCRCHEKNPFGTCCSSNTFVKAVVEAMKKEWER